MKRSTKLMLAAPVGAAALALAACGGNDAGEANEAVETNLMDANMAAASGGEADLRVENLRIEVDRVRQARNGSTGGAAGATANAGTEGGTAGAGGTGSDMASNQAGSSGTGSGTGGGTGTFADADLDGDGRITPAEFAVYELDSVQPAQKAAGANDEMMPFVSDEALNRVIDNFRRLDANGDFSLSSAEYPGAGG